MGRIHALEFEDLPGFPEFLRVYMRDYLSFTVNMQPHFLLPMAEKLRDSLKRAKAEHIVDLCSGSGGPTITLVKLMRTELGFPIKASLTDLYPRALAQLPDGIRAEFELESTAVDATRISSHLSGFRTLFNAFHHFRPRQAQAILRNAAEARQGIFVAEMIDRSALGLFSIFLMVALMPILSWAIRPFKLSRLFFTLIVPLLPFFTLWDGIASWLRIYSKKELRALVDGIKVEGYDWEIGTFRSGPGRVTYVLGLPRL